MRFYFDVGPFIDYLTKFGHTNPSYSPRSLVNPCKRSGLKALAARSAGQPPHFTYAL